MNKAVIVNPAWAAGDTDAPRLLDADIPLPQPAARDLVVEVKAIALNPVDLKMMRARIPSNGRRVLGWDAAGTVVQTGGAVENFKVGDDVFYAGTIGRDGAQSQFHAVDERLVGHKPRTLGFGPSAALAMAGLVSFEALFERMGLLENPPGNGPDILVWGAAGGVGTVAMQLASRVAKLRVIATASRPESADHCLHNGAHHVIDHNKPAAPQLDALGIKTVPHILCLADPAHLMAQFAEIVSPFGIICCLSDSDGMVAVNALRAKSASFIWEGMFTRPIYRTADMDRQSAILGSVARCADQGHLHTHLARSIRGINAASLNEQYTFLENGRTIGKIVLER